MADFYDANAAIAKPNILNSVREGIQYADATRDANTARANAATDRAEAAHEKQLKQLRGAAQYMKQALQTGNPAAVSGAWQAVRPFLSQAGGQEPPAEWTPDMEAKMEQALAQTAYLDKLNTTAGNVQSTQIDNEGNIWTVDRSGNWTNSGIKAAPTGAVINQPGNVPFIATTGRGQLGAVSPIGGAPSAPPQQVMQSNGVPVTFGTGDAAIPPEIQAAIAANPDAASGATSINVGAQPAGNQLQTSNAIAPGPIRNPTAAEAARASHVATSDVFVPLTQDEIAAAGLPPGTFAQRNLTTGKIEPGPAAVQPKSNELSARSLKIKFDAEDSLNVADSLDMTLGDIISQIESGELQLGPVENLVSTARNYAGQSTPNSVNYATFKASLEKLRNDVLILNKGVQTEGDARRAMNAILATPNDEDVVIAQMNRLRVLNDRARTLQQRKIDQVEQEAPSEDAPDASGEGDYSSLWGDT